MKNELIRNTLKSILAGFLRTLHGTATAGLFALSVYGFAAIPTEGGYIAVCEFIGAVAIMCLAIVSMYALGAGKVSREGKKKGRFAA